MPRYVRGMKRPTAIEIEAAVVFLLITAALVVGVWAFVDAMDG